MTRTGSYISFVNLVLDVINKLIQINKVVIHKMENVKVALMPLTFVNRATVRVVESAAGLMGLHLAALPMHPFSLSVGVGVC